MLFLRSCICRLSEGFRYKPEEVTITQEGVRPKRGNRGLLVQNCTLGSSAAGNYLRALFPDDRSYPAKCRRKCNHKSKSPERNGGRLFWIWYSQAFFDVEDKVIGALQAHSGKYFKGTSNVYFVVQRQDSPFCTFILPSNVNFGRIFWRTNEVRCHCFQLFGCLNNIGK